MHHETLKLQQAAEQAQAAFEHETAVSLYTQALADAGIPPETRYQLLNGRSECYSQLGNLRAQAEDLAIMARLAGELGNVERQIEVINRQVAVTIQVGNYTQAQETAETAVSLARHLNHPKLEADSLDGLGMAFLRQSLHSRAEEAFEQARTLYQTAQDLAGEATSLLRLSDVARFTNKPAQVQTYLREALTIYRQLGDRAGEARTLNGLGVTSSDYAQKRSYYERALTIFQAMGNRERQLALYNNLGLVYLKLGLYGQASRYGEQALKIGREMDARSALAACLDGVGRAYLGLGNWERAEQLFTEGLNLSQSVKSRQLEAYYWFGLGRVAQTRGDIEIAQAKLETAESMYSELGITAEHATTLAWLGAVHLFKNDWQAALQYTTQATAQLASVNNISTEFPPQDVWWLHYCVLRHRLNFTNGRYDHTQDQETAWQALEKARELMLSGIATLSDEGLRRNYLNKVQINHEIVTEWARQAALRHLALTPLTETTRAGNVQDQLQRMLDIGLRLTTQRDASTLPHFIMDEVVELSGAERAFLVFLDATGQQTVLPMASMAEAELAQIQQQATPILERVTRSWQAVMRQDEPNGRIPANDVPELHLRSILGIPLVSLSNLIGMIYADMRLINGRFTQADLDLLTVLANQAATAIENARLYEEILQANRQLEQRVRERTAELQTANISLERRIAELDTLADVSRDILATLDLNIVLDRITQSARELLTADTSAVCLLEENTLRPIAAIGRVAEQVKAYRFRLGEGIIGSVAQNGQADYVNNVAQDPRTIHITGTSPIESGEKLMVAPLFIRDTVIGAMAIWRTPQQAPFSQGDLNFLVALSRQVSIALENARLFADTEKARHQAEVAQAAAEDASQAKTAFLANMSHEIRTPLNAVIGFTRIVRRKSQGILPDKQVENLDKVLVSAEHLLALINTILDIAKIEARRMDVHPSEFDAANLAELCITTITPLLRHGVLIEKEAQTVLPMVYSDQDKIKQIVINLLSNAAKFTHEGKITVMVNCQDEKLSIAVRDSGIGISEEALPRVFEEFQQAESTTRRDYGGTGLGLPISRTLARLLGGDLTASSIVGAGSTFTLTIPVRYQGG